MADQPKPTTMSENARAAAQMVAADQQKRPGKKVRVVAIADGYDGFKVRQEGERFIAWWPDAAKNPLGEDGKRLAGPSWQMEEKEYDRLQRAAAKVEADAADIGE